MRYFLYQTTANESRPVLFWVFVPPIVVCVQFCAAEGQGSSPIMLPVHLRFLVHMTALGKATAIKHQPQGNKGTICSFFLGVVFCKIKNPTIANKNPPLKVGNL